LLYEKVKAHPTVRQILGARLVNEGVVTTEQVEAMDQEIAAAYQTIYESSKNEQEPAHPAEESRVISLAAATAVPRNCVVTGQMLKQPV